MWKGEFEGTFCGASNYFHVKRRKSGKSRLFEVLKAFKIFAVFKQFNEQFQKMKICKSPSSTLESPLIPNHFKATPSHTELESVRSTCTEAVINFDLFAHRILCWHSAERWK